MATDAENIVSKIVQAATENVGVSNVSTDGTTVSYETPEQRIASHKYWSKVVAKAAGRRPTAAQINLGGF